MKDIQQLIKKNSQEGRYEDIFPKTFIDAIKDKETKESLGIILNRNNFLFLTYVGSESLTRLQVPMSYRRSGLWVAYQKFDKSLVVEFFKGDYIDNDHWGQDIYWFPYNTAEYQPHSVDLRALAQDVYDYIANSISTADNNLHTTISQETDTKIDTATQLLPEDLSKIDGKIQLADRQYDANNFSGLGHVVLRRNIVDGKNVLTQAMINKPNTIYEIRYDFDLNDQTITIPAGCVLDFNGGSFSNGIIVGTNTIIKSIYPCLEETLILNGSYKDNTIDLSLYKLVFWGSGIWKNFNIESDVAPSTNRIILNNLVNNGYNIIFPKGILPFDNSINFPANVSSVSLEGVYSSNPIKETSLIFPSSSGIVFGNFGKYSIVGFTLKNLNIESKKRCIDFNNKTLKPTDYPTFTEGVIDNVHLYSIEADCIASDIESNMYKNVFRDIHFCANNEHGFANNLSNLENIFDNISDGWSLVDNKPYNTKPLYVFRNMSVILSDSNLTNTLIKYLLYCDGIFANAHNYLIVKCCNLESFTGPILYSPNKINIFYVDVDDTNVFVPHISFDTDIYKAYFVGRCDIIKAIPTRIYGKGKLEYDFALYGTEYPCSYSDLKCINENNSTIWIQGYNEDTYGKLNLIYDSINNYTSYKKFIASKLELSDNKLFRPIKSDDPKPVLLSNYRYLNTYVDDATNMLVADYYSVNNYYRKAPVLIPYRCVKATVPTLNNDYIGAVMYCSDIDNPNKFIFWNGSKWTDVNGSDITISYKGSTENRPTLNNTYTGFQYFDTAINKPIWWTGTKWVDATGATV